MTSKISFRKLLSDVISHRLWIIILISAVAALAYPILLQTFLHESIMLDAEKEQLITLVYRVLGRRTSYTYVLLFIAAVISSASCFSYLNSREKTDFYHSVAVKRREIYVSRWIAGILVVILPYMAAMLVSILVILPINGLLTGEMAGLLIGNMFFFVFAYSAVYAICVLAMTFSGRILTGLFLMAVFLGYVPCVYYVLKGLFANFYPSLAISHFSIFDLGWGFYTSPLSSAAGIAFGAGSTTACWIITAVFLVGGFFAGMYVHKVRASETAGRSMTFPVLKSIIKISVGILIALIAGYIGVIFFGDQSIAAFIIWALVATFLVNMLIEFFYGTDFKTALKKWKSALIMFGVVVASIIFIAGDPLGINKWKPEINEVNRMSFHTDFQLGEFGDFYCNEVMDKNTRLEEGLIQDFEPIYEAVDPEQKYTDAWITTYFEYELKNGKKVRRNYAVSEDKLINMIYKLSDSGEFREKYYPTWIADLGSYNDVQLSNAMFESPAGKSYSIPKSRLSELVDAIKEDSIQVGMNELSESIDVARIIFSENEKQLEVNVDTTFSAHSYRGDESCMVKIYPQYKKTISFLREITGDASIGDEVDFVKKAENIKNINIYTSRIKEQKTSYFEYEYEDCEVNITDKNDIVMLLESIKEIEFGTIEGMENTSSIEMVYKDETSEGFNYKILDKKKYDDVIKKYEFKPVAE